MYKPVSNTHLDVYKRQVKYNPITKEEKKYDISNYHKYSGGIISPTIDILDDSCYYISNTGMYKFDINLENFKVILNEDVFFNSYIPLYDCLLYTSGQAIPSNK